MGLNYETYRKYFAFNDEFVTTTHVYQFYVVGLQAASGTTSVQLQDLDTDCLDACKKQTIEPGPGQSKYGIIEIWWCLVEQPLSAPQGGI